MVGLVCMGGSVGWVGLQFTPIDGNSSHIFRNLSLVSVG